MIFFWGCLPKNHAGARYEINSDLPWRGAMFTITLFLLAVGDILEDLGQFQVVRANFVPRIDVFDEVKEALLAQSLCHLGIVGLQQLKSAPFLLLGHRRQGLP